VEIDNKEGLYQLAEIFKLFRHYQIKGTFFLLLSPESSSLLKSFDLCSYSDQHEFGLHIHWGESNKMQTSFACGLKSISSDILRREMAESLECCKRLGVEPKSFRGGGLSQTTSALEVIHEQGFLVDSSVAFGLNEKESWFQEHTKVPARSWYFPEKRRYDLPASLIEDRLGILEVPVTRLVPSLRSWAPYTLTPTSPLYKAIVKQWLFKSWWENPLLITPIFHSWGTRYENFISFLKKLSRMMEYLLRNRLEALSLSEVYDRICALRA